MGKLYIAFIDFKKAFDTHLSKLSKMGMGGGGMLAMIKTIYRETVNQLNTPGELSDSFRTRGIRQVCPLGPRSMQYLHR